MSIINLTESRLLCSNKFPTSLQRFSIYLWWNWTVLRSFCIFYPFCVLRNFTWEMTVFSDVNLKITQSTVCMMQIPAKFNWIIYTTCLFDSRQQSHLFFVKTFNSQDPTFNFPDSHSKFLYKLEKKKLGIHLDEVSLLHISCSILIRRLNESEMSADTKHLEKRPRQVME